LEQNLIKKWASMREPMIVFLDSDPATWVGAIGGVIAAGIAAYAAFQAREAARANVEMANLMRAVQEQARNEQIAEIFGVLSALRTECEDALQQLDPGVGAFGNYTLRVWPIKRIEVLANPTLHNVAYAMDALERDFATMNSSPTANQNATPLATDAREKATTALGVIGERLNALSASIPPQIR
jgi:hypothetical protein